MIRFVVVVILCSVLCGGYYVYSKYCEIDEAIDYAALSFSLLKDVSSDWSYLSLKKHIDPERFEAEGHNYIEMLKKASHLGDFKACNDLKLTDIKNVKGFEDLEIDGKALLGGCSFENGEAQILHIFKIEHGQPVTIGFGINNK